MAGKPWFVVSDVHLGAVPPETERAFRAYLDYAAKEAAGLVINGDLFDVWVPSRRFVMRRYMRTLAKLAEVVENGFPVYFLGGNHDAVEYGGAVLREDAGVTLLDDPTRMDLGPFRALIAHGDGAGVPGSSYRKENSLLLSLLRNRAVRSFAERLLPIDWVYERARSWSRVPAIVARQQRGEDTGPKPDAPRVNAWAREELRRSPDIDLVLVGHSHLPELVEVEPGRFYVNTGDWIEHMTYGVLPAEGGHPQIRRWPNHEVVAPRSAPRSTEGLEAAR